MESLEQIIRRYIQLPTHDNGSGWFSVVCKVCNDHGKKGPRAGFKFDTTSVGYHCFNCGHKAKFDPTEYAGMSKDMRIVLHDFGVPDEEWQQVLFDALKNQQDNPTTKSAAQTKKGSIEPQEIPLPEHFYLLSEAGPDDKWAEIAIDYLESERKIDPKNHPFMLSRAKKGQLRIDKWRGRLIIPVYKQGKLIFYQGRALFTDTNKKYESPATPKDRVLYGFDLLFEHTEAPLYIVEGIFDAMSIDGVAIIGNEITDAQTEWLNRSKRRKVYIPDRFGDGRRVALDCLGQGWSVSTPDVGSCKDMNEAVKKYGKVYVMKSIAENIADGLAAETKLRIYSEQKDTRKKKN